MVKSSYEAAGYSEGKLPTESVAESAAGIAYGLCPFHICYSSNFCESFVFFVPITKRVHLRLQVCHAGARTSNKRKGGYLRMRWKVEGEGILGGAVA